MFQITSGLFNGMVICRGKDNTACQRFSGETDLTGALAYSLDLAKPVPCGSAANGRFQGEIAKLAIGGPYTIAISCNGQDVCTLTDIYVGDVWLLGGQSNMQGVGCLQNGTYNDNPAVRAFYMDNHWDMANDPLHLLSIAKARVHWDIMGLTPPKEGETPPAPTGGGVGPGLAFGRAMFDETGVPQGLISCAHGGTKMTNWDPASRTDGDASLYGAMLERFQLNGGKVTGIIWYQGESDARAEDFPLFAARMDNFISELRKDLHDDALPFIQVQLGRHVNNGAGIFFSEIRQEQLNMDARIPRVATVPAIDLPLEDDIHLSAEGQETLGRRLADAACALLGIGNHYLPIRPVKAEIIKTSHGLGYLKKIMVTFENMVGTLSAPGVPTGFTIDGIPAVIKMELLPNKVLLFLRQGLRCESLEYGLGTNPYCNLTDAMGRSLPTFTLPIDYEFPRTTYADPMRVSMPDLRDDDLAKLDYSDITEDIPGNGYFTQKGNFSFWVTGLRYFARK